MQTTARPMNVRLMHAMLGIALVVSLAGPAQAAAGSSGDGVKILSPKDGQHIGDEGDKLCPSAPKPCNKIRAEGRVPEGRFPFFAVEPVNASPKMWIQPLIHRAKQDGSFSGLVHLGEEEIGAQEYFKIYLFACDDQDKYRDGQKIFQLPKDCLVSDPVEVYRER